MSNSKSSFLAVKIKKARKQVGLSQKQMGQALKLSDKAISAYEVGRAMPTLETLKGIGQLTNYPVSYFVSEVNTTELELQAKLNSIEKELQAIRKLLAKKKNTG